MWELPRRGEDIFCRPKVNRKEIVNSILTPIELDKIVEVMVDFMRRQKRKFTVVKRDRLSIKEKLISLKTSLELGSQTTLKELLKEDISDDSKFINEVVITFISLLELARLKKVEIFQTEHRGQVYVKVVQDLQDLDVDKADGFDDPEQEASESQKDPSSDPEVLSGPLNEAVIEQPPATQTIQ